MSKTDIVIVHYGNISDTNATIESVSDNAKFRNIIVINNNPNADLKAIYPKSKNILIINSKLNKGFAGGVNVGIRYALDHDADYIVLLNNDTIVNSDFITPIVKYMENNTNIGICSPVIEFKKNGIRYFDHGGTVSNILGKTKHTNLKSIMDVNSIPVDYVSGCCMVIKKEVFQKIGQFDERFFMYYEDVDFCERARKSRYDVLMIPKFRIFHLLSKTSGKNNHHMIFHLIKSSKKFYVKYFRKYPLGFVQLFNQSAIFIIKKPSYLPSVMKGWL